MPRESNKLFIRILSFIVFFALGVVSDRFLFQKIKPQKLLGTIGIAFAPEEDVIKEKPEEKGEAALVTRVLDGDTIEIESGQKVRYIGIDTPESVDPRKPVECFAKEASEKNKSLVEGKKVRLVKDVSETDRYNRLLRYVYVNDTFINLELVKDGYAISTAFPPDVKHSNDFKKAAATARQNKRGLWNKCKEEFKGDTAVK